MAASFRQWLRQWQKAREAHQRERDKAARKVQLEVDPLERRWVPNDVFGLLRTVLPGLALGLAGQKALGKLAEEPTPYSAAHAEPRPLAEQIADLALLLPSQTPAPGPASESAPRKERPTQTPAERGDDWPAFARSLFDDLNGRDKQSSDGDGHGHGGAGGGGGSGSSSSRGPDGGGRGARHGGKDSAPDVVVPPPGRGRPTRGGNERPGKAKPGVNLSETRRPDAAAPAGGVTLLGDPADPRGGEVSLPAQLDAQFAAQPLAFEANEGQAPLEVQYLTRAKGYTAYLTGAEAVVVLAPTPQAREENPESPAQDVLRLQFPGANAAARAEGLEALPSRSNYFLGSDRSGWHGDVAQFGQVAYRGLFPGVDLTYRGGDQQRLRFDFTVAPGADPGAVRMRFGGVSAVSVNRRGELVLRTAHGEVTQRAPVLYQDVGSSRVTRTGRYLLNDGGEVGFLVDSYDPSRPLVIDPTLAYGSYLGGSGTDEAKAVAVDLQGNVITVGTTSSTSFPTGGPFQSTLSGSTDVFVSKVSASGALVYSTYLGGVGVSGGDEGAGVAVDAAGNAYVTGRTSATNFPATPGAFQSSTSGVLIREAFVTKLSAAGNALVYSTYLGGSGEDVAAAVAIDAAGNAYVTGSTSSSNFPTTAGAYDTSYSGSFFDPFLTKLKPDGSGPVFSTYLGGASLDQGTGVAVDPAGNAYVVGLVQGTGFPTAGAYQSSFGGGTSDAFLTKVGASGASVSFSSYLGGGGDDRAYGVAVDAQGQAVVAGYTQSTGFPTTAGAFDTALGGGQDGFVTRFAAGGATLSYSTFLGGSSGSDAAYGVALDDLGTAHVTGVTSSVNFPTVNATQPSLGTGGSSGASNPDAFVTRLASGGASLTFSTYLGGGGTDQGNGVATHADGRTVVVGSTTSTNFPTAGTPVQGSNAGGTDAFLVYYGDSQPPPKPAITSITTDTGSSGTDFITKDQTLTISGTAVAGATVNVYDAGKLLGVATANGAGSWTLDHTGTTLSGGNHPLTATATVAGRTSLPSPTKLLLVDVTPPTVTLTAPATTTDLTPDVKVSASDTGGSGFANGAAVALDVDLNNDGDYTDGGETNHTAGVLANGNAVLTPSLGLGTVRLRARVSDKAGNEGPSNNWTMTIKPPPPAFTSITTDTGYSAADFITNDQTLQVSGTATAGATVELTRVGVGVLGTATANGAGQWTYNYTATTLAEGLHAFTAKQTVAGHDSDASPARLVWVDLTPPAVTLSANGSGATNATVVTVNATDLVGLPPGAPVTLDVDLNNDNDFADSGEAGYDSATLTGGTATFTVSPDLPVATVRLRARVTDKAGNEGTSSAVTVVVLPAAPPITAVSTDTGSSASDFITNDQTLTISGTADAGASVAVTRVGVGVLGSATANGSGLWTYDYTATSLPEGNHTFTAQATLSGQTGAVGPARLVTIDLTPPAVNLTAPEDSTPSATEVSVTATDAVGVPDNALVTLDVDLNNDNDFTDTGETGYDTANLTNGSVTFTVSPDLPVGTVKVRARVTDKAGNEGTSATATVQVVSSLTTPDPPVISSISTDSGSSATDFITNDQTLTITGTSVANGTVEVFDGGGSLGTTTANSSGDWSFDYTGTSLAEGGHPLTAKVTLLGQTSAPSDVRLVRVDLTAPAVTLSAPAEAPTDDAEVTVTATDAVGIPSGATVTLDVDLNNDNDFTDTGETGYDSATLTVTGTTGTATFTVSPDLPVGTVKLRARVTDKAGNEGTSGTSTLVVPPATPEITGVATDTGSSASDLVTYDPTLVVSGTSDPGASITVYEGGVSRGSTTADGSGAWSFNYTGTTLPEGDHGFTATATVSGQTSSHSELALVRVDLTPPDVELEVPSSEDYEPNPEVTVTATDLVGLPDDATVALDVDLNNDGDFTDLGETGYQTEPLVGGTATFAVTPDLPEGTSGLRARVTDLAGNEGSSQTGPTIDTTVDVLTEVRVSVTDPFNGDSLLNQGNVSVSHGLDLDGSPGGGVALVYESRRVDVRPVVQLTIRTDADVALPATISADLFWDGGVSAVASQSFSTTGFSQGDLVTLALQVPTAQTVVGRHAWVLNVSLNYAVPITFSLDDVLYLVPAADSPYGSGWSFSHVDRLYSVSADANGPAGMLRAFGSGGWAFYEGVDSFVSPPGDNGTLTRATAGGVSTYTYAAATGEQWTFNAAGMQTKWASADGQFTRASAYTDGDADGQADDLATQTNPDGTLATFTYASNKLRTVASEGPRTVTLTHTGTDLTQVANPDGGSRSFSYDLSHRLTGETYGGLSNSWAYGSHGLAATLTWGGISPTGLIPSISRGLGALAAGPPTARKTDPLARVTTSGLDRNGRPVSVLAADNGLWQWERDGQGRVVTATDPFLRTTTFTRDAQGFVTREDFPDGTHRDYQYQAAFHALVGLTDERGSTTGHGYDAQGHLVTTTNALNQVTTYAYNADGTLQKVTDALNHTTTFLYDSRRRLTTVTNALGGHVTTAYDAAGNATAVTDPVGTQTRFGYDPMGRPVTMVEAYGTAVQRTTTTAYDAAGHVTGVTDPLGVLTRNFHDPRGLPTLRLVGPGTPQMYSELFLYDAAGQLTATRDPNAAWSSMGYDAAGRRTSLTDPLQHVQLTQYAETGEPAFSQDELQRTTMYEHDLRGRVTLVIDAFGQDASYRYDAGGLRTSVSDPLFHTTTTAYDALGRPTVTIDPLGSRTTTAYDAAGNVTAVTDPRGVVTRLAYDELDRRVATTQAHGTTLQRTVTTAYDAAGRATAVIDPLGVVTVHEYDALGRGVKTVEAYGTPLARTTTTAYDAADNVLWVKDPLGRTTTPGYDALHRLVGVTDPLGHTATVVRDAAGRVVGGVNPLGQASVTGRDPLGRATHVQDPLWNTSRLAFDRAGNTTSVTDPRREASQAQYDDLNRPTRLTDALANAATVAYDAAGHPTVTIDPLGGRTTFAYDALGRLTSVQQPLVGTATTAYDENGNVVASVNPLGQRTTFVYDELNRRVATVDPLNQRTTSVYDAADRLVASVDALDRRTTSVYDALGRRVEAIDALGGRATFTYDAADHLLVAADPRGARTTYGYDDAGRLTRVQDALGGVTTTAYDNAGRVTATIDARGYRTTYAYDWAGRRTAVTDPLNGTTTTAYDAGSNVTAVTDPRGVQTRYGYDDLSRVVTMVEASGTAIQRTTTTAYDPAGRVTGVIDPLGVETRYDFDALGRRVRTVEAYGHALQRTTTTAYDDAGRVTATVNPRGHQTDFAYDDAGRLTQTTDPLTNKTTTAYDANGNVVATVDPRGFRTTFAYDGLDRRTSVLDPLGNRTTTAYDANGNATLSTDARGNVVTTTFDALNRVWTVRRPDGGVATTLYDAAGNLTTSIDPLGGRTTFAYDGLNRRTSVTDPLNGITTTAYDASGNVTAVTDPRGVQTRLGYDALSHVVTMVEAHGTPLQRTTTTAYDPAGHVTAVIDPAGVQTRYEFDALGRPVKTVEAYGTTLQRTTTTAYDAADNVTATVNPRGHQTDFAYDDAGRLTQTTDALGHRTTSAYDANGNVTVSIDPRGSRTTFAYDGLNRRTSALDPLGNRTTTAYDANGNATLSTDALGHAVTTTFDALNRVWTQQQPHGGVATTLYDAAGNLTTLIDPLGGRTTFAYDGLGRRTSVTDPTNAATNTIYDANGNVSAVVDPAGNRTTMHYDALNRVTQEVDPFNKSATSAYDAVGRLASRTDRLGRRKDFGYDALGRVVTETWVNNGGSVADRVTYTYDANNNVLSAADGDGALTYTYDELDRPATRKDMFGTTLTYGYDAAGNRTSVQDSLGGLLTSAYNGANLLTSRQLGGSGTPARVDLSYTPRLQVATLTRYSDLAGTTKVGESLSSYDTTGRLSNLRHKDGSGTTLANYTYTYDADDRVTTEVLNGTPKTFSYDAADQVTNDSTTTYTYDAAGNRTMTGYATGTGNRMTNDGVYTYTYDDEGNLVKKSKGSAQETWTYGYDHDNQLLWAEKRASDGGTLQMRADYDYDTTGRRIEKAVDADGAGAGGTATERFSWDGSNVWADLDGSNALVTRRVFGDQVDQLWCKVTGATPTHYLSDRLGSVRDLVSNAGAVLDHLDYDGFGKVLSETSPANGDRYAYAGFERDGETGNYYSVHRYYDPATGRWLTEDPTGFGGGDANLYRYVANNSTNATDPTGLWLILKDGGAGWTQWQEQLKSYGITGTTIALGGIGKKDGRYMVMVPAADREKVIDLLARTPEGFDRDVLLSLFATDHHIVATAPGGVLSTMYTEDTRVRLGGAWWSGRSPEASLSTQEFKAGQDALRNQDGLVAKTLQAHTTRQALLEYVAQKQAAARSFTAAAPVPPRGSSEPLTPLEEMSRDMELVEMTAPWRMSVRQWQHGLHEFVNSSLTAPADLYGMASAFVTGDAQKQIAGIGEAIVQFRSLPKDQQLNAVVGAATQVGTAVYENPAYYLGQATGALFTWALFAANAAGSVKNVPLAQNFEGMNALNSKSYVRYLEGRLAAMGESGAARAGGLAAGERLSINLLGSACFVAGTPLLTPEGEKCIEDFRPGDLVLSRPEHDAEGPVEAKAVEAVFVRAGAVLALRVGGRDVRTTAEHPFYVRGQGWRCAGELRVGEELLSADGSGVAVEAVGEPGGLTTVYNLRVADYHTYFVGCDEWGFSVWAHNADCVVTVSKTGQVQVWEVVGGKRTGKVLLTTTVEEFEGAALRAANKGELDLPALRKALVESPDARLNVPRPTAKELPVLERSPSGRPAKEWNQAADAIRNPTKSHGTDVRVRTYAEAEQLMRDAGLGELPYYEKGKTAGWDRYQRGFEVHPAEPSGAAPQNNLPHIKWKTELGDGHIYFGG